MPFDRRYHHRQSIRLRDYDYSQPNLYFVTLCTYARHPLFDETHARHIAERLWESMPYRFDYVTLDAWILMPDHFHGLLYINDASASSQAPHVEANTQQSAATRATKKQNMNVPPRSLSAIIRTYKSMTTRQLRNQHRLTNTPVWQRGYWERIVRDEAERDATRRYISGNPARWAEKHENLDTLLARMSYEQ